MKQITPNSFNLHGTTYKNRIFKVSAQLVTKSFPSENPYHKNHQTFGNLFVHLILKSYLIYYVTSLHFLYMFLKPTTKVKCKFHAPCTIEWVKFHIQKGVCNQILQESVIIQTFITFMGEEYHLSYNCIIKRKTIHVTVLLDLPTSKPLPIIVMNID